jgi:hypothetical protein
LRIALFCLGAAIAAGATAQHRDYVVLAAFEEDDAYDEAARVLRDGRNAEIVRFDPADLAPVRAALIAAAPRNVALVMRPEQIDFVFARRFLQLATEIDDDPFVDFAYGYITGLTPDDATALARRGIERLPQPVDGHVAMVAGGVDRSVTVQRPFQLREDRLRGVQFYCAGEKAFAKTGRDRDYLKKSLPRLAGCSTVTFVGHGYPREVVGGPTAEDLEGVNLADSVALNVACYTGVTKRWFEDDWKAGVVRLREIEPAQSFGLAVLHAGVVGYTAYLCPRPAGPELDTDLAALVADGVSLGEARRRDYDKTVLGHLGFGAERLRLAPVADGDRIAPGRDAVRDIMLEGATGGVLFGDPACVPFAARPGQSPVEIEVEPADGELHLRAEASLMALFLHCSDPTAKWDDGMAMRVYTRLPLGERHVTGVVVDELEVGGKAQSTRVLWAVEHDRGERFLHLKVNFPRAQRANGALTLTARVLTTGDPALAVERGGEVTRLPDLPPPLDSREIDDVLLARAAARDVRPQALQAAVDAAADLFAGMTAEGASGDLIPFGSEGFRAVCAMLEVGRSHFRMNELLIATWRPGDEQLLLELAKGPPLPNWATWTVLRGLGAADTEEVRAYLLQRLATEEDPGNYMSIAYALARLGRREAAAAIGDRALEFREAWAGVEGHLVAALAELGGADAITRLERLAADGRANSRQRALDALDTLDAAAAARVRAGGEEVR